MPYRLQKDEPLPGGLKRIAEEEITGAIQPLQSGGDLGASIYQVRKRLKKVRAILRLLQPQLGPIYVEENRRLRDLARRFSGLRDLDVSLELLEKFAAQYKRKTTLNPQRKSLSDKRSSLKEQTDWQAALSESLDALAGTRKRIEDWPIQQISMEFLNSQIRKTHKQSRHAFDRARKTLTPSDFHDLRKSVKRELNQCRLMNASELQIRDLKELSQSLGDHHNLAVLLATVENASARFRGMTVKDMKAHETQILELASRIYDEYHHAAVA